MQKVNAGDIDYVTKAWEVLRGASGCEGTGWERISDPHIVVLDELQLLQQQQTIRIVAQWPCAPVSSSCASRPSSGVMEVICDAVAAGRCGVGA